MHASDLIELAHLLRDPAFLWPLMVVSWWVSLVFIVIAISKAAQCLESRAWSPAVDVIWPDLDAKWTAYQAEELAKKTAPKRRRKRTTEMPLQLAA